MDELEGEDSGKECYPPNIPSSKAGIVLLELRFKGVLIPIR